MTLYRNAFHWMNALLAILLIGFWPSCFSRLTEPMYVALHLHSVAMLAWVLLLIVLPDLGRALDNILEPMGLWTPTFLKLMAFSVVIALWLMMQDRRRQKPWWPHSVFSVFWAINIALYLLLPKWSVWNAFSGRARTLTV